MADLLERLHGAAPPRRAEVLTNEIRERLSAFLGFDSIEDVGPDELFSDLGANSGQAVEFKLILDDLLGLRLGTAVLFEYPSAARLAGRLLKELGDRLEPVSPAPEPPATEELTALPPQPNTPPVAIVALACRFPGADDPSALFARSLANGFLNLNGAGRFAHGRLDGPAGPDRLARLAVETVERLLDGLAPGREKIAARSTGVFLNSATTVDAGGGCNGSAYRIPLANQISYTFDFRGPSETVNAFCAGAFLALRRAVQAIRGGECRQAIVGGVSLIEAETFQEAADAGLYDGLLATDNRVHSFGRRASGFVRSEGAGLVFLKSLDDARADGDTILAVVRGAAVRHAGRGFSPEAPNVEGMAETARACLLESGLRPGDLDYIEAHGIGHPLADGLELAALHQVYEPGRSDAGWHLSCVKPVVGHPELASGMASLIKAVLAIREKTLPPLATAGELTGELPEDGRFRVERTPRPWRPASGVRRVALNSYSIGGLNAHVILEEPPRECDGPAPSSPQWPEAQPDSWRIPPREQPTERGGTNRVAPAELLALAAEVFEVSTEVLDLDLSPLDLGFDSIRIVEFVQRANEELGLGLRFAEMMTIRTFGQLLERSVSRGRSRGFRPTSQALGPGSRLAVSETQRGMWYVGEVLGRSTSYNVPITIRLDVSLNLARFDHAIERILDTHPALRVRFVSDPSTGSMLQEIRPAPGLVRLSQVEFDSDVAQREFMLQEVRRPFSPETRPLLRAFVLRREDRVASLFLVIHHLVIDGLSAVHFIKELWHAYESPEDLAHEAGPDVDFFEFVEWERAYLGGDQAEADRRYWLEYLAGVEPRIHLDGDAHRIPPAEAVGVGCESFELGTDLLGRVKALAADCHSPPSAVLLAAFLVLLGRYGSQSDVAVTTPVGLRPLHRFRRGIGCFINLIVTRARLAPDRSFRDLVIRVRNDFAAGVDHGSFPYARLLPLLGLSLNRQGDTVFPVSFTYQNIFDEWGGSLEIGPGARVDLDVYQEVEDDLTLEVYDFRYSVRILIKHRRSAITPAHARRMLASFRALLEDAVYNPTTLLGRLDVLGETHQRLLDHLSGDQAPWGEPADVLTRFDAHAASRADSVAIVSGGRMISYGELKQRSIDLAEGLKEAGFGPDNVVGLQLPRSPELIVGMLAVLRLGAVYLPIEVGMSGTRLDDRLGRAGAVGLIDGSGQVRRVASEPRGPLARIPGRAYILFTSGSTGRPKGVGILRSALAHLCRAMVDLYGISSDDRVLLFASPTFDMSVEEIFPALTAGASVVIRGDDDLAPERFARLIESNRVSIANLPPSFHDALRVLGDEKLRALYARLRVLAFGGDRLPDETLRFLQEIPVRVFNVYGPTECTVNVSAAELTGARATHIGRPLPGVRVDLLSESLELVPPGVAGEICVSGWGVAPGYLDPEDDRRPAFVSNPFGPGQLYRTGDRARWRDDGQLELLGRLDDQLSLFGHRVEPAEVESALAEHPDVAKVAVVGQIDAAGLPRLVAFYESARAIDHAGWRSGLRERLPAYMIPCGFRRMERLPINDNGKLDRQRLAELSVAEDTRPDHVPPTTATERLVVATFERRLSLAPIGLRDHFFDLGGHSLLAIQISAELGQALGREVSLRDFFSAADVESLAALLDRSPRRNPVLELDLFREDAHELVL